MERKNPFSAFLKFSLSLFGAFAFKKIAVGKAIIISVLPDLSSISRWGIVCAALLSTSLVSLGQVNGDYRTLTTGNWDVITTWEKFNGTSWIPCPAGDYPGALVVAGTVNILNGHIITLTNSPANAIGALTFEATTPNNTTLSMSGQTLNINGAVTFGVPTVNSFRQRIILGTGTLNCASILMPTTGAASRTIEITISTGILNVGGNITMIGTSDRNNIIFSGSGVLNVGGNLTGGGFTSSTSTVNYNGTTQLVGGFSYYNLNILGGDTKTLAGAASVTGSLTLNSGVLKLGSYNLTLTNTTAIGGAPFSVAKMIETDGTGRFIRSATALNSSFNLTYPIGSGGYYSPVDISGLPAGVAAARTISVRAVPSNLGILSNTLNKYWDLSVTNISTALTTVLSFQYDAGEVIGDPLLFQPYTNTSGSYAMATGPSFPGSNPATSTGSTSISGFWTVGSPSTFYSYQTGFWDQTSTWTFDPGGTTGPGTSVPGFNDKVIILSGRTVTLTDYVLTQELDVTIISGGILDQSTFEFTNSLSALRGAGILKLSSSSFPTAILNTFVATDGGTTEYNYSGPMSATQATYYHLTISTAGTVVQLNNIITLNGNLNVKQGTFQINDASPNRLQLIIKGDVIVDNAGLITVGTGVTNTVTTPTGITGTTNGFLDYYERHSHRVQIYGDFINNGIVRFTNLIYPVYDRFPPTSIGPTTGFATVYFQGLSDKSLTCNGQTDFYNLVLDKGTDQTFKLTVSSSAYNFFRLYGANTSEGDITAPATTTANPNLKKALWIKNGTLVLRGLAVIPSLSEGATAGPPSSDYFIPAKGALLLDGAGVIVLSTADDYKEVNAAYSVAAPDNVSMGINATAGNSALSVLGKLQINDGYLSTRESGGILYWNYASGQFIMNGGIVDTKQFHTSSLANSLISYTQSGGNLILRGRFQRTTTVFSPIGLVNAPLNTVRSTVGIDATAGSFNITNSGGATGFSMSGGTIRILDVCGNVAPTFAFQVLCSVAGINVTGGTVEIIPTTGTVPVDDADYMINTTAPVGNLLVNRASGTKVVSLNTNPVTVLNNLTLTSGVLTAINLDVTIGGNFFIASGTTYTTTPGTNTTIFNGTGAQAFTVNLAAPLSLNQLTINKPAGVALNFAGSQSVINVAGNFRLVSGNMNDNGNTINIAGNVFNSGIHNGTGKIVLNGTSTQSIDGNGIFSNLELNNTNGAAAPVSLAANITINGLLTFSQDKLFNINIYNLKLNAGSSIANGGPLRYIQTAGNAGDGGLTKEYSSTTGFLFPVGASTLIPARPVKYTPATIGFSSAPTTLGSITVIPVGYEHPATTVNGQSLTYFWRVTSSGFSGIAPNSVTHTFVYDQTDVAGTEGNYIPSLYNRTSFTWNNGTSASINTGTNIISDWTTPANSADFLDADYTAGDVSFGSPLLFYSIANSRWNLNTTWSYTSGGPAVPAGAVEGVNFPGPNSIVIIENNHIVNLIANQRCASLQIQAGSTLDIYTWTGSIFSMVLNHPGGNGLFRLTTPVASASAPPPLDNRYLQFFTFPAGDFTDFNVNHGTTEYYDIDGLQGALYILPPEVTTYGNLILTARGGDNLILPNNDYTTIYGDLTCTGNSNDSWVAMSWNTSGWPYLRPTVYNPTKEKTVHITGNLFVNSGTFIYMDDRAPQHLIVDGNVTIAPVAIIDVFTGANGAGGTPQANTLAIGGNFTNNSSVANSARFLRGTYYCDVTFFGSNNASITNTAGTPTTIFNKVIVNKGNSQATTLTLDIGGTLTTLANNWLALQNGTLRYMRTNPGTDFTISQGNAFTIPSTAGLYIDYSNTGNRNILIADANSNTNDLYLNGKLTLIRGNVYVGPIAAPGNNNDIEYSVGGASAIDIQGGSLVVNGQIRRDPLNAGGILKYSQSGGSIIINGRASNATNAKLEVLNSGSDFTMSNGTLTIIRGNGGITTPSSPFGDLYLRPQTSSVTGGTIIFSQGALTTENYFLDANVPLSNLTITGAVGQPATVRLLVSPLVLNGNMTINANSVLNSNNINVTFNGNLINTPGIGGYIYGTNLTKFSAAGVQTITGATNFYDLVVNPGASLSLNNLPLSPSTVFRNLTLSSGIFILGANAVSVKGNFTNDASYTNVAGNGLILDGTNQQLITGFGAYAKLTLNNAAGAQVENDITLQEDLTMTLGILDIKKNLVSLGVNSNILGGPFNVTKMITSDGVFSNVGLKKFFNPVATSFLYPIGTSGKYTPALLTITASSFVGWVRINNINSRHPAVLNPANALDYYWEIQSSGITGFSGKLDLNYLQGDVIGDEPNYLAARLLVPGITWSLTSGVDTVLNRITTNYSGSNNLSGEYTAGTTLAFFNNVPIYTSNKDGLWKDNTIWDQTGGDIYPCPVGGPNGFIVIVKDTVTIDANYSSAYRTTINNILKIKAPSYGHNLGTVDGSGTLYLESGSFPAGVYNTFLGCANFGTVEYGGTGTYTIVADLYDNIRNIVFSGTGTRVLPNKDLTICNQLIINGPTVDNSVYNKKLIIQGTMSRLSGTFKSGSGAGATVSFAGALSQAIGGAAGDFTGSSAFHNLEINNSAGLRINNGGAIEVSGKLLLTNGLINTAAGRNLTITNPSNNCVIPAGGSANSFVDGPLIKDISQYDNFLFPIGIYKVGPGNILGNKLMITLTQTGPLLWSAEYKSPNGTSNNITLPLLGVSAQEYYQIKVTAGSQTYLNINWTPASDVTPLITGGLSNIRLANYNTGTSSWVEVPSTASGNDSNGTATSTFLVASTGSDDYTLGSITDLKPRAKLSPTGPVCGTAGIPVIFTAPYVIPFNYTLNYTINGFPQIPITITPATLTPYIVPTPGPGVYKLTDFRYNSGASIGVVDASSISVFAAPSPSNTGSDQTWCGITTVTLDGNKPNVGTGFWSIVSGTGGTIMSPTDSLSQFIGLNGASYRLRWTISSGTCTSSDDVIINFTILPNPPGASPTQSFCGPKTVGDLLATPPVGCSVDWYSAASGGSPLGVGTPLVSGNTYYAESNGGGVCMSLTRTQVVVTVNSIPVPSLTGINSVCVGSTGNLYTTEPGMSNYLWTVVGGFISSGGSLTSNTATVTWTTSGLQTVSVNYNNATGCTAVAPTIQNVTVTPDNTITLSSGSGTNNQTNCINTTLTDITFSTTGATGANVTGLPPGVFGTWSANVVTISGTPSTSGAFFYTVTLTGGCGTITATGTITVNPTPVSPALSSSSPGSGSVICAGYNSGTATFAGGSGGGINEYMYSIDGGSTWSAYSNSAAISTTGGTTSVQVRARRSGGICAPSAYNTYTIWTLGSSPSSPALSSALPANGSAVCSGYNTGMVTGAAGSGGSTGATDEYQVSINGGGLYNPYISGTAINTTGATTSVIVQSRRTGGSYGCTASAWSTISTWTVSSATVNPTLNVATPAIGTSICAGYNGPGATITAGSGGSTGASDLYEYSINDGGTWSAYSSGTIINTTGATTNVLIRVSRSAGSYGCSSTGPATIVTWPVASLPAAPTLSLASPASGSTVCAGFNTGTVTGAAGTGGSTGATDEYQVSINGGVLYNPYINGAPINTTGATASVIVQSRRTGGSYGCTASAWSTISTWVVGSSPSSPALSSALPANGSAVCSGYNTGMVTGAAGSGGSTGATDEYQVSINGGGLYNPYISGTAINTTGATTSVIVQSRRTGGSYGCTASAWSTISTWTVSSATVNPTLNVATPAIGTSICAGYNGPGATITAGSGGSTGASDLYEYSINDGGTWSAYSSGTIINTTGATTNVLIRVSRSAGSYGCSSTGPATIVTWPVASLPAAPTLSLASPASGSTVCAGFNTGTVTGAAGTGGSTGATDEYQVSINGGVLYNPYINGAPINTTGATASVIVQSRRTGGSYGCTASAWSTISTWVVGSLSTAPTGVSITNNNTCNGTLKTLSVVGGSLGTGATWQWFTGSCGGASAGTGSSIVVDPGAGTSTTYYVRSDGACNTTVCASDIVITSPGTPSASGAISGTTPQCPGLTGQTYNINAVAYATTYTWTVPSGWTITSGAGTTSITVTTGSTGQDGDISVTADNTCGASPATTFAVIISPPSVGGTVSGGTSICSGSSSGLLTLSGHTGTVVKWQSSVSPFTIWTDITNTATTYTSGPLMQITQFRAVVQSGSCTTDNSSGTTVTIDPSVDTPVFTLGAASTRCQEAGSVIYLATATNSTGIIYSLDLPSLAGGNTIDAATGEVTYAAGWSTTTTITASASGCNGPTTTTHVVTINPLTTISDAGPDQSGATTCGLTTTTLTANTPAIGTGSWSITGGAGGTITTLNSPTSTFSGIAGIVYTLRWTISNPPCTESTDDVDITFSEDPTVSDAGPDQTGAAMCGLTSTTLAANTPAIGTGLWSIESGTGGTITSPANPTSTFTGTSGTAYLLRWTISNSCTSSSDDVNITFNQNPTVTSAQTNVLCFGTSTGAIDITAAGGIVPYTYAWTGAGVIPANEDQTDLAEGLYSVIVTDANSCSSLPLPITITQPAAITGSASVTTAIECSDSTGTVTVVGGGGTALLSFTFNGVTNDTGIFTGIPAGVAFVWSVTDANGCGPASGTLDVTEPAVITGSASVTTGITCNGGTATLTIVGGGGTGILSYTFDGVTNDTGIFTGIPAGLAFAWSMTDANSCGPLSGTIDVTEPEAINIAGIITHASAIGGSDGAIDITVTGGTLSYSFLWTTVDGSGLIPAAEDQAGLTKGTYNIVVTDGNGCNVDSNFTVFEPAILTIDPIVTDVKCNGGSNGSIQINVSGGISPYTYSWTTADGGGLVAGAEDQTTLTAGTYNLTVTDNGIGIGTGVYVISEPPEIVLTVDNVSNFNGYGVRCYGANDGSINISATGGTGALTVSWTGPSGFSSSTGDITDLFAGSYIVIITDSEGCSETATVQLTEPLALSVVVNSKKDATCPGEENGEITLTISGGIPVYNVLWSDDMTIEDRPNIKDGNYRVDVTDLNGCATSLDVVVGFVGTESCLEISQIITPNDDGHNDTWKIKNIDLFPNAEVFVYSRWGKLVFNTKNISANEWNGRFKGKLLPTDSYHYVLHLNDGSEPRSGVVSIIR